MASRKPFLLLMTALMVLVVAAPVRAAGLADIAELEPRVQFWLGIYTQYTTRQAVLHDSMRPEIIYGVIDLGGEPDGGISEFPETDSEIMELGRQRVSAILLALDGGAEARGEEELLVQAALAHVPGEDRYREAAERVRSQRGLADRFRLGLIRSGRYIDVFKEMARNEGVPEDLAFLPHVESSFDHGARSHVGASGMWQFMRSTGRLFMTIDSFRDERMDPYLAGQAAFKLLRENYEALGSWPLAVTAYNHGRGGMLRARKQFGPDLPTIIENYRSRTFGFASKSFYAEFLAARRIATDPEQWFGPLEMQPPLAFETCALQDYVAPLVMSQHFELPVEEVESLNPALSSQVWEGRRLAPKGYELRLPPGNCQRVQDEWVTLPANARFERDFEQVWHRVRKGENLSLIASRYKTSVARLRALNGLRRGRYIHPGQRLRVVSRERWIPLNPPASSAGLGSRVAGLLRHVVRRGETLSSIGIRYGIHVGRLVQANALKNPSQIHTGQVLVIPGSD